MRIYYYLWKASWEQWVNDRVRKAGGARRATEISFPCFISFLSALNHRLTPKGCSGPWYHVSWSALVCTAGLGDFFCKGRESRVGEGREVTFRSAEVFAEQGKTGTRLTNRHCGV